jgi:chromosome partitioning protein
VGKSTLAILCANHLSQSSNVFLMDTDRQRSILDQRRDDTEIYGEEEMKYGIEFFRLSTVEESESLMQKTRAELKNTTVLIDIPGNITDDYIAPLLLHADYIVCPYQYEGKVLESTSTFIQVIQKLRKIRPNDMKAVLLMVPNMIDSREGTEGEKENWKKVDEVMAKYGRLMPKLPLRTDFKRLNTYVNSPRQEFFAREFFKELDGILK